MCAAISVAMVCAAWLQPAITYGMTFLKRLCSSGGGTN